MLSSTLRPFKSFTRLQLTFRPGGGGCGGQGSCSKGEHTLDPSDHDNCRCDDDKYNCDDDHIWQLLLWPWQSKAIILVMMKVNDKIFATVTMRGGDDDDRWQLSLRPWQCMTINDKHRTGAALLTLYWEERLLCWKIRNQVKNMTMRPAISYLKLQLLAI